MEDRTKCQRVYHSGGVLAFQAKATEAYPSLYRDAHTPIETSMLHSSVYGVKAMCNAS